MFSHGIHVDDGWGSAAQARHCHRTSPVSWKVAETFSIPAPSPCGDTAVIAVTETVSAWPIMAPAGLTLASETGKSVTGVLPTPLDVDARRPQAGRLGHDHTPTLLRWRSTHWDPARSALDPVMPTPTRPGSEPGTTGLRSRRARQPTAQSGNQDPPPNEGAQATQASQRPEAFETPAKDQAVPLKHPEPDHLRASAPRQATVIICFLSDTIQPPDIRSALPPGPGLRSRQLA